MPTVMGPEALASELTSLLDHAITCVFKCTSPYKSIQPKDTDTSVSPPPLVLWLLPRRHHQDTLGHFIFILLW